MTDRQIFTGSLAPYRECIERLGIGDALPSNHLAIPAERLRLGGVLPFLRQPEGGVRLCLMRPVAKHAHLPPPQLQICKGTRMKQTGQGWLDMQEKDLPIADEWAEPLAITALREGEEELGLPPALVTGLWNAGTHRFTATSGKVKGMALFWAEISDPGGFAAPDTLRAATAEVRWLDEAEAAALARPEHAVLLPPMIAALRQRLGI